MSDEPKTRDLPAAGPVEVALRQLTVSVERMNGNIDSLMEDGKASNQRMSRFEVRLDGLEGRISRNSEGARGLADRTSSADLAHDAKIAEEITRRQDLAQRLTIIEMKTDAQTVMLERLVRVAANPLVQKIATAAGTAVLTWLTMRGLK